MNENKLTAVAFTPPELTILNNILVEHCMSMVELVNSQEAGSANLGRALNMMKASVSTQQFIFNNAVSGLSLYPQTMLNFIKALVSTAIEGIAELKEMAFRNGMDEAVKLSETHDLMKSIIEKIPEPSRIIV